MKRKRNRYQPTPRKSLHQFKARPNFREYTLETAFERGEVDKENGVIKGVSVITNGVSARGHDLEIDDTTLKQMYDCAVKMGQVPTKWNHKTGADAVNGYLQNFSIEGGRLRADWYLLKEHSQFKHAIELAERMPSGIGLSASFTGEPEKKKGKNFARCEELISTDLVAKPAANPTGLFEERVDRAFSDMLEDQQTSDPVLAALEKLNQRFDTLEGQVSEIAQFNDQLREQLEADDEFEDENDDLEGELDDEFEGEEDGEFEGEGDFEGEGEMAGVGEGASSGELAALYRRINQLEAREHKKTELAVRQREEHAFSVIEGKTAALIQELEDLRVENQILLEFRDKVRANGAVDLSDAGDEVVMLSGKATDYERRVHELCAGGMKRTVALKKAMGEGRLYEHHLAAKGIVNHLG